MAPWPEALLGGLGASRTQGTEARQELCQLGELSVNICGVNLTTQTPQWGSLAPDDVSNSVLLPRGPRGLGDCAGPRLGRQSPWRPGVAVAPRAKAVCDLSLQGQGRLSPRRAQARGQVLGEGTVARPPRGSAGTSGFCINIVNRFFPLREKQAVC